MIFCFLSATMTRLPLKPEEEEEQKEVFIAFARIYSGTVKKGQRVFVLGPKYDPAQGLSLVNFTLPVLHLHYLSKVCRAIKKYGKTI